MLCHIISYFTTLYYYIILSCILLYSIIYRDACYTYNIHKSSLIHSFAAAKALMFQALQRSLDVDAKRVSMLSKLLETSAIM